MDATRPLIFIGGCARSGTSALCEVMNAHRSVCIGIERYSNLWKTGAVRPEHFEPDRFFELCETDTHYGGAREFGLQTAPRRQANALVLGDKEPPLDKMYEHVWRTFPAARVLYIVRDPRRVALSYQRRADDPSDPFSKGWRVAVADWNRSARATIAALAAGRPITVVSYDRVLASRASIRRLYAAFGLDFNDVDFGVVDAHVARAGQALAKAPPPLLTRDRVIWTGVGLMADWKAYCALRDIHCLFASDDAEVGTTFDGTSIAAIK
jgi:hypothetical protein